MITGILYGREPRTLKAMGLLLHESIRRLTGEECRLVACEDDADLVRGAGVYPQWDIACVDIGDGNHVEMVHRLRESCGQVDLLLIADANVSPMIYIRPGVMPTGLVQRPARVRDVHRVVEEFVRHFVRNRVNQRAVETFSVETREGVLRIPFPDIVCFESRSKRIALRTDRNEYVYYDTLDKLQDRLPSSFVRCHRGFIVNTIRVRQLHLGQNQLEMDDDTWIPVSRSYKATVKERLS